MQEVYERLFVGSALDCCTGPETLAVVHACKNPCHVRAVGYRGRLPREHPNYLVRQERFDLYLNIIDPDKPLFMPPLFSSFSEFTGEHWDAGRAVLIHCNLGESRAPTLALLFLAKHVGAISKESYVRASQDFVPLYSACRPGLEIQTYMSQNWSQL